MQTGKGFDQATYDATKTYLKAALEQMIAAGHAAEELAEFATDKFGGSFYPYLREFQQDIRTGRIKVQGLTETSRASVSLQSSIDLSLGAVLNSTADGRTDDDMSMLGIELCGS